MPTLGVGVGIGVAIGIVARRSDSDIDPDTDTDHYCTTDSPERSLMHMGNLFVHLLEIERLLVHEFVRGFGLVTV